MTLTQLWARHAQSSHNHQLQHELLMLVHNNDGAAKRLIQLEQLKHPGKTEQWYLEKVIYDLRRDV